MVRAKSSLAMLMQVFTCIAVVSVTWVLLGYSLAFGEDLGGGLLGDLRFAGGRDLAEPVPGLTLSIPPVLFSTFQMMFAVITVALIAGAVADRVRFGAFVAFATLLSVLPWRVSAEEERVGLDQSMHAETAYDLGSVRSFGAR